MNDTFINDIIKAKRYAAGLLARRMYTEREMNDKLRKKGFGAEVSHAVVSELLENGYIDDLQYARLYFEDGINVNAKGICRISAELLKKGVLKDTVAAVSDEIKPMEYLRLKEYAAVRLRGVISVDFKEEERLKAHLVRRGYSAPDINRALKELKEEAEVCEY